jgi:hypothetical protein
MRALWAVAFATAVVRPADAERYIVERGETLEHVAKRFGCRVDDVLRANGRDNTLVPAGTRVAVPACGGGAPRLSITGPRFEPLPRGEGYVLRRPTYAFGERHVIAQLRGAIAGVRALRPELHVLAIGDLSAERGGPLERHVSHQTGLDADIGLFYTRVPADYPVQFVDASAAPIDLAATWALLAAFARTADAPDGVQLILLDRDLQARLYRWARERGTPDDELAAMLQYPREPDAAAGLVRHWPHHADHMHVRWKARQQ